MLSYSGRVPMAVIVSDVEEHRQPAICISPLLASWLCKEIIQVRITPKMPCREEMDMMLCRAHD
jgi:hypothetical protein